MWLYDNCHLEARPKPGLPIPTMAHSLAIEKETVGDWLTSAPRSFPAQRCSPSPSSPSSSPSAPPPPSLHHRRIVDIQE